MVKSKIQNIGAALLGGSLLWMFIMRQSVRVGVRGISLNGLMTLDVIPLRVAIYLINDSIGSILVRSINCQLVSNGLVVASISQNLNKRIPSHGSVEQDLFVDIHNQAALSSFFANVQTGDVTSTSFTLVGEVVIGEHYPLSIKINKLFTWEEIKNML